MSLLFLSLSCISPHASLYALSSFWQEALSRSTNSNYHVHTLSDHLEDILFPCRHFKYAKKAYFQISWGCLGKIWNYIFTYWITSAKDNRRSLDHELTLDRHLDNSGQFSLFSFCLTTNYILDLTLPADPQVFAVDCTKNSFCSIQ